MFVLLFWYILIYFEAVHNMYLVDFRGFNYFSFGLSSVSKIEFVNYSLHFKCITIVWARKLPKSIYYCYEWMFSTCLYWKIVLESSWNAKNGTNHSTTLMIENGWPESVEQAQDNAISIDPNSVRCWLFGYFQSFVFPVRLETINVNLWCP